MVDTHVHVNDPGPHRVGGLRIRHQGGGGRRRHDDHRHAAEQRATDGRHRGARPSSAPWRPRTPTWTSVSGVAPIPGNRDQLRPLHDAGVFGFKCFLLHSGVDEFPPLDPGELRADLEELRTFDGSDDRARGGSRTRSSTRPPRTARPTATSCSPRPRGAENVAIAHVIELARWTGARVHILHLSSSDALPMIESARRDGVRMTVETCPHYLVFTSEEIAATARREFKCCPPIREETNRDLLWQGARRRHDRLHRLGPLAVHARAQTPRRRRFRPGLGRHRLAAGRAARRLDRGAPAGIRARRRRAVDVRATRGAGGPDPEGAARRRRATPTSAPFAPDETFVVDVDPAASSQPRDTLCGKDSRRRRPPHLAARPGTRRRPQPRTSARPDCYRRLRGRSTGWTAGCRNGAELSRADCAR